MYSVAKTGPMTGYRMRTPERWFIEFCKEFRRRERLPDSEIPLAGDPKKCTGWTSAMGVFLSRLAHKYGYTQDWEFGDTKIDFVWLKHDRPGPRIAIEHECWHTGVFGRKRRVIGKLVQSRAPLKVLITYGPGASRKRWEKRLRNRISKILVSEVTGPILVVTANDALREDYYKGWSGAYTWGAGKWYYVSNPFN